MGSGLFGSRANSIMHLKMTPQSDPNAQFMSPREFQSKSSLFKEKPEKKKRYHVNNYLEDIASSQFLPPVTSPRAQSIQETTMQAETKPTTKRTEKISDIPAVLLK